MAIKNKYRKAGEERIEERSAERENDGHKYRNYEHQNRIIRSKGELAKRLYKTKRRITDKRKRNKIPQM